MPKWEFCKVDMSPVKVKSPQTGRDIRVIRALLLHPTHGEVVIAQSENRSEGLDWGIVQKLAAQLGMDGWEPISLGQTAPWFYFKRPLS